MEITSDQRNELFKRQELILKTESETTPNFTDIKNKLAEEIKKPDENIDVYGIKSGFGNKTFSIHADIYDSVEDLNKIKKLQSTNKQRKEEAKVEKEAKDKPAEEKPTEETKVDSAQTEDKPEQTEAEPENKPEAPANEDEEEETKAVEEEIQKEEENKE